MDASRPIGAGHPRRLWHVDGGEQLRAVTGPEPGTYSALLWCMMKDSLMEKQRAARQAESRIGLMSAALILPVLVVGAFVSGGWRPPYVGEWMHRHYAFVKWEYVALLLFLVIRHARLLAHKYQKLGLVCRGCQRPLIGRAGRMALQSGTCGRCGAEI